MVLPPTITTTRLTLTKALPATPEATAAANQAGQGQLPQQQDLALDLSPQDLQSFVTALLDLIPATMVLAAGSGSSKAGSWLGPATLQVRYNPGGVATAAAAAATAQSMAAAAAAAGSNRMSLVGMAGMTTVQAVQPSPYEIKYSSASVATATAATATSSVEATAAVASTGSPAALQLTQLQLQSLSSIFDAVLSRVPSLMQLPPAPQYITPATDSSPLRNLATAVATALKSGIKLVAVGALVLLPLASMSQGSRSRDLSSSSSSSTSPQAAVTVSRGQVPLLQPVNDELQPAEVAALCERVRVQFADRVWLPLPAASDAAGSTGVAGRDEEYEPGRRTNPKSLLKLKYQVVVDR